MLLNHGDARSRLLRNPLLMAAQRQGDANERVSCVVERSRPDLQYAQHALKSTGKFRLIYGFPLPIGKNVAVRLYAQR